MKIFVNKNGVKSATPLKILSFDEKVSWNLVFFLSFANGRESPPKGWVFFLSFLLEFCPWVLVFSAGGVKKKPELGALHKLCWLSYCWKKAFLQTMQHYTVLCPKVRAELCQNCESGVNIHYLKRIYQRKLNKSVQWFCHGWIKKLIPLNVALHFLQVIFQQGQQFHFVDVCHNWNWPTCNSLHANLAWHGLWAGGPKNFYSSHNCQ